MDLLTQLAANTGNALLDRGQRLATAESCTGGLVAATCTAVAGSSEWFEAGFVTYRLSAKERVLGLSEETLMRHGAVSEPVARDMALAALTHSDATLSVSVTGIAGPSGGEVNHPVGTVWFGWAARVGETPTLFQTSLYELQGTREAIRLAAVRIALEGVATTLQALETG